MGLRVNSNLASTTAQTSPSLAAGKRPTKAQRLSASLRIPTTSDDAASLVLSEQRRTEIRLADQATRNANSSVSLLEERLEAFSQANAKQLQPSGQPIQPNKQTASDSKPSTNNNSFRELIEAIDTFADAQAANHVTQIEEARSTAQAGS